MKNTAYLFVILFGVITMLILGKSILIPFVFALLFWLITRKIRMEMDRIPFIKRFFPKWLKNIGVFTIILLVLGMMSNMLSGGLRTLIDSYDTYAENLEKTLLTLEQTAGLDIEGMFQSEFDLSDYRGSIEELANSLSGILSNLFMVIIYALFIFLEENSFKTKLAKLFLKGQQLKDVTDILVQIETSISGYLMLKTGTSLLTGAMSYLVLLIVGVDSPIFWAFLIFILNFIPTIGSLIATLFPAVFSLLQFGEFTPFLIVLAAVGVVQVVVGNIIEPRIMGKSLNISPLVTIIALSVWGSIWGITGMIMSVPITVAMVIAFSHIEKTKAVAVVLSEDGDFD